MEQFECVLALANDHRPPPNTKTLIFMSRSTFFTAAEYDCGNCFSHLQAQDMCGMHPSVQKRQAEHNQQAESRTHISSNALCGFLYGFIPMHAAMLLA